MISTIVQPIGDVIKSLPYVGRYGGIVNVARRLVEAGVTENGDPIYREEVFPVACGVSASECWEDGMYRDLIPNDEFASIFYLEQTEGMRYEGDATPRMASKTAMFRFTERLRLVGWLNLPKLGIESCNGSDAVAFDLVKHLNRDWKSLSEPVNITKLSVSVISIEPKERNPFEKYSYNEMSAMWMYPYDYVSLLLEVDVTLNEMCMSEFIPGVAVECAEV